MTIQITVIGLNQVGASIGLALAERKDNIQRFAHDADINRMKRYEKEGAFDRTFAKIGESVRGSEIVILSLPLDMVQDALTLIAKDLKPGAVVIDTSILSKAVSNWASEILPKGTHFISVKPVINPAFLEDINEDLEKAHADLFEKGHFMIASDFGTNEKAIQTATELAELLKAQALFTDPMEADGLIAGVEQLPVLTAAALTYSLSKNPGWTDSRKVASKALFRSTSSNQLTSEQDFLGINLILNKESITQKLDQYISTLIDLRDMINDSNEEELNRYLKEARSEFETWVAQKKTANWDPQKQVEMPGIRERLFGGNWKAKKPK